MKGYFLYGTNDEIILVFKTKEEEEILNIIKKIATMRSKEIKALASQLEESFYERSYRNTSKPRSENQKKSSNSPRSRNSKTNNPKYRFKPSS
jgi:hypothetical protein